MTEDDIEACYRDTSRVLSDWHSESGFALSFRIYEQTGDRENEPPEYGPEWTVEIRLGRDHRNLKFVVTLPCESWQLVRDEPDIWRDLVTAECDHGARELQRSA